jgi:hypothetical protein
MSSRGGGAGVDAVAAVAVVEVAMVAAAAVAAAGPDLRTRSAPRLSAEHITSCHG